MEKGRFIVVLAPVLLILLRAFVIEILIHASIMPGATWMILLIKFSF